MIQSLFAGLVLAFLAIGPLPATAQGPIATFCPPFFSTPAAQQLGAKLMALMEEEMKLPPGDRPDIDPDPEEVPERFKDYLRKGGYGDPGTGALYACFPRLKDLYRLAQQQRKEREAQQAKRKQEAEAEANKPVNVLRRAYGEYIYLQKCYAAREGYLSVNISDKELERAKVAVQNIEQKMISLDSSLDKAAIWAQANAIEQKMFDADSSLDSQRRNCQNDLQALEKEYTTLVPDAKNVHKDF